MKLYVNQETKPKKPKAQKHTYIKEVNLNGPSGEDSFGSQRFKQEKKPDKNGILPTEIGKIGNPLQREYHRYNK